MACAFSKKLRVGMNVERGAEGGRWGGVEEAAAANLRLCTAARPWQCRDHTPSLRAPGCGLAHYAAESLSWNRERSS